mmetsp:Transcript_15882/g.47196  ORF Transcript_15882/g.47196 Transcript_15882/m.47196 type:complete len:208 (-) Transcript_15882:942-1565(-)
MRCSWRRYIISHCATSPIPPDGRRGIVGNDILQYRRQLHAGMGMGMRVIGAALRALRPASAAWRIPVPGLRDLELRSTLVSAGPTCMRFRRSTPPCRSANFRRSLLPAPPPPPPPTASTASNRCPRSAPSRCAAPPPRRRGRRSTASRTRRPSARPTAAPPRRRPTRPALPTERRLAPRQSSPRSARRRSARVQSCATARRRPPHKT